MLPPPPTMIPGASRTCATSLRRVLIASRRTKALTPFLQSLTRPEMRRLIESWALVGLPYQFYPGLASGPWPWIERPIWLLLGGRGAGKTRTGAEWIKGLALGLADFAEPGLKRIALVGETFAAVRDVMVEGPAGVLAVHRRGERPAWTPSLRKLEWPTTGAVAHVFSAEDPESLRGPQFEAAWADELAKWRYVEETWTQIQFGLRLGAHPRELVTTTPRPIPLLKRMLADPRIAVSRARTADNAHNLAPAFLEAVVGRYAGTRLGRQELDGEIIDDRPDALWTRDVIEACRVAAAPPLARIVVAVDPPASSSRRADSCGLVAAGITEEGIVYVLDDETRGGLNPQAWAARAIALYRRLEADALVIETNQGGEMASAVLREVDADVPVVAVHATRGKYVRAEPVAVLYAKGRVHHVGALPALEDELCDFGLDGLSSGRSPDRLDALVWALTELALKARTPRVRGI
jgi:phage terminase large subunit-like protein